MKATDKLHSIGQSIWLDNITRGILNDGTLSRYIDDLSVTGLLWASTSTKDPDAPDTLYVEALAAPDTANTILEKKEPNAAGKP
jgi:hypothetical protein